jgi:hypothetical protein
MGVIMNLREARAKAGLNHELVDLREARAKAGLNHELVDLHITRKIELRRLKREQRILRGQLFTTERRLEELAQSSGKPELRPTLVQRAFSWVCGSCSR